MRPGVHKTGGLITFLFRCNCVSHNVVQVHGKGSPILYNQFVKFLNWVLTVTVGNIWSIVKCNLFRD
jgi:hypothetical protein